MCVHIGFLKIELQFTYHKTHPFKVYDSVLLSIFTRSCNHHHYLIPEHFLLPPKETLYPLSMTPYSVLLMATTNLLSLSMNLPVMDRMGSYNTQSFVTGFFCCSAQCGSAHWYSKAAVTLVYGERKSSVYCRASSK